MDTGTYISGAGHGFLVVLLAVGGLFQSPPEEPLLDSADVSLISAEEFAALTRPAVEAEPEAETEVPAPVPPEVDSSPVPEVRPSAPPETAEPPEPAVAETPEDPPVIPEEPPLPEIPVTDEPPVEIQPPAEDTALPDLAPPAEDPAPRDASRVAPIPVPETPAAPEIADTPAPRVDPDANTDAVAEETPDAAPEEATTEIVTEADRPATAPSSSPPPVARPAPPARPAPETETAVTETPPPPATDTAAIDDALTAALSESAEPATPPARSTPAGPPMSQGEREALRVAISQCWNLGTNSSEALRTVVVVSVAMARDGTPDTNSIRLVSATGGGEAAVQTAFDAARRAIVRCGARGYDLPPEKYEHWKEIEITFNPERMRNR